MDRIHLAWAIIITCFITWLSMPAIGLIWIKNNRLDLKFKILLGVVILFAFAIISIELGNYMDNYINASIQATGK